MTDFHDIKVGDEVGFRTGIKGTGYAIGKVTKVTPKSFDVGLTRFDKANGRERGGDVWDTTFAKVVDDVFRAGHAAYKLEQQRQTLARQLEPKLRTLSLEQLKQIEAIASGGEGE